MTTSTATLTILMSNGENITINNATVADIYRFVLRIREESKTLCGFAWKERVAHAEMFVSDADAEGRYALGVGNLHDVVDIARHYLLAEV